MKKLITILGIFIPMLFLIEPSFGKNSLYQAVRNQDYYSQGTVGVWYGSKLKDSMGTPCGCYSRFR